MSMLLKGGMKSLAICNWEQWQLSKVNQGSSNPSIQEPYSNLEWLSLVRSNYSDFFFPLGGKYLGRYFSRLDVIKSLNAIWTQ